MNLNKITLHSTDKYWSVSIQGQRERSLPGEFEFDKVR
jgi:hypothetical protein